MPNFLVNDFYPTAYWSVPGTTNVQAPKELWWSSRERTPIENGLPAAEYLEVDFGRLRHINFLSFDIMKKPVDITVEFDSLSFENGAHTWVPVSRITDEHFDNYVDFDAKSTNPWMRASYYFLNPLGDMVSTRWLRIKFNRRVNDPASFFLNNQIQRVQSFGVNFDNFPWAIDIKNLRTSRIVSNLDDTRGLLFTSAVTTLPVDTEDAGTVTSVAVVSGVEIYSGFVPPALGLNDFPDGSV